MFQRLWLKNTAAPSLRTYAFCFECLPEKDLWFFTSSGRVYEAGFACFICFIIIYYIFFVPQIERESNGRSGLMANCWDYWNVCVELRFTTFTENLIQVTPTDRGRDGTLKDVIHRVCLTCNSLRTSDSIFLSQPPWPRIFCVALLKFDLVDNFTISSKWLNH